MNKSPRLNLPGEGDGAGCVAGAGVAVAFFIARCFAGVCDGEGDSAGLGDCACEIQIPANPIRAMRAEIFVIMSASVKRRRDYSQSNSGDTRSGRGPERNFSTGLERAGRLRYPLAMIIRISALIALIGLAGICISQAQSPSPAESPSPRQTPAKHRAMKKATATPAPATHPAPSPSPGKFNLGDLFKPKTSGAAASPAAAAAAPAKGTSAQAATKAPAPGGGHGKVAG